MKVAKCPKCERRWAWVTDQACAIKLIGHCIVCWDKVLDGAFSRDTRIMISRLDDDGIIAERKRREKVAGYQVEPCPNCLHRRDQGCKKCNGLQVVKVELIEEAKDKSDAEGESSDDE